MKIQEFWNHAYLACLTRLPPVEAEIEATQATDRCIAYWNSNMERYARTTNPPLWKDQDITWVPISGDDYRKILKERGIDRD